MLRDLDDAALYRRMVEALGDHVPGDSAAARELIGVFVEQAGQRLEALTDAIEDGVAAEVETQAHSLKSSCALLGLDEVAGACADLEERGRQGDLTDAATLAEAIATAVARIARATARAGP